MNKEFSLFLLLISSNKYMIVMVLAKSLLGMLLKFQLVMNVSLGVM